MSGVGPVSWTEACTGGVHDAENTTAVPRRSSGLAACARIPRGAFGYLSADRQARRRSDPRGWVRFHRRDAEFAEQSWSEHPFGLEFGFKPRNGFLCVLCVSAVNK